MLFSAKTLHLRDGQKLLLRSPRAQDAEPMLDYMRLIYSQTPYLLHYPEDFHKTAEQERSFLEGTLSSPNAVMIVCEADGEIVGTCQLNLNQKIKTHHRASIGISLAQKYCGLGIGTALMEELISIARQHGVEQLELEVFEGNERAIGLYRKMGFVQVCALPDAIRLKDGRSLALLTMIKKLPNNTEE